MPPKQPFLRRDYYSDPRRRVRSAFARAARRPARWAGFDLEVRSFYSPIPVVEEIPEAVWVRRSPLPGITLDLDRQLEFLERVAPYTEGFTPPENERSSGGFYLKNGLFQDCDAFLLYAIVRALKPRRVIELGTGFSTLVCAAAVVASREEGHDTQLVSCDPYAQAGAVRDVDGLAELRPVAAEEIGDDLRGLQPGDVLFIDSSHTVRLGGDVVHLLCEVVPRLPPGVFVHLHDIYLPYEYPRKWFTHNAWYWAEQYLLQALLVGNAGLDVTVAAHALWRERRADLARVLPKADLTTPPLSFWMQVREPGG